MMRTDCRHYESRTYPSGEAVRKCDLDLAPEAPWRCPEGCARFERRADVAWSWGGAVAPPSPPVPDSEHIAEVLDAAEEIVNAAGPGILAELAAEGERARRGGRLHGLFRRRKS